MSDRVAASDNNIQIETLSSTLDLCALHDSNPDRYPFLLQSTAIGPELGRFDILFVRSGESLVFDRSLVWDGHSYSGISGNDQDFLQALDNWWSNCQSTAAGTELPFSGGWFLYLGYELAAQIEPTLELKTDPVLPAAFAVRCPAAIIRRHEDDRVFAICESAYASYMSSILHDARQLVPRKKALTDFSLGTISEDAAPPYLSAVESAKLHIAAGDVYQANLSRSWRIAINGPYSVSDIYSRLCEANPAPFAGLVRWKNTAIASSSPERLVAVRGRQVSTRPIAGTRPRGTDESGDIALTDELFQHPKERAEHVMLIDLERNDLGRICEAGSVCVDEFMVLESYAHVHHIVSNVQGKLAAKTTPGDVIRAMFPGGTITGCPKVRCMEIIAELEDEPRGAYTGSIGYLNRDGSLDLNILIRTMVIHQGQIHLKAGSGIVADSEPESELAETRAKAKGLLMAIR